MTDLPATPASSTDAAPAASSGASPVGHATTLVAAILVIASGLGLVSIWQREAQRRQPATIAWHVSLEGRSAAASRRISWKLAPSPSDLRDEASDTMLADARLDRFRGVPRSAKRRAAPAVLPPEERWTIEFDPGLTIGDYAQQLDALGVELGILVDAQTMVYATKLSDSKPKSRRGARSEETRLYLTWARGDLVAADRILLSNAGIDAAGQVVLHFLPQATEKRLAELEQAFGGKPLEKIGRTVFGMRKTFRGYELYVKRQLERR